MPSPSALCKTAPRTIIWGEQFFSQIAAAIFRIKIISNLAFDIDKSHVFYDIPWSTYPKASNKIVTQLNDY